MQQLSDLTRQDQCPVALEVADWSLPGAGGVSAPVFDSYLLNQFHRLASFLLYVRCM